MDREQLIREIEGRLGHRQLVWAGLRREDAIPLTDISNLGAVFGILGEFPVMGVGGTALEQDSGVRIDPEVWDIDEHLDEDEVRRFRAQILACLNRPSILLPYRSSRFLSSLEFARLDTCEQFGVFWGQLAALEHKPWVETSVSRLGVRTIPWRYIANEDQLRILDLEPYSGMVLRRSRSSGGEGFVRVSDLADALERWPSGNEAFVSAAPFINGLPVNIGAVVWRDGVTVHHPSVQLIGIRSCTNRPFGFCGNDFGAAKQISEPSLIIIDGWTRVVGTWLRSQGFIGAFGVDFIVRGDEVYFAEVNPRFQGSTLSSSKLSAAANRPCLLLEHIAAWLGIPLHQSLHRPILELVRDTDEISNLVVHWTGETRHSVDSKTLTKRLTGLFAAMGQDVLVPPGITNEPESTVARIAFPFSITRDGYSIDQVIASEITQWQAQHRAECRPTEGIQIDS